MTEDEMEREIRERIEREKRFRNAQQIEEHNKIMDSKAAEEERLNPNFGTTGYHKRLIEKLEKRFELLREIDQERFQKYADSVYDGTYKEPTHDPKAEKEIDNAELALKGLQKVYGSNIPKSYINAINDTYGPKVLEEIALRQKQQEHDRREKAEQERQQQLKEKRQQDEIKSQLLERESKLKVGQFISNNNEMTM
jgi:hypothetical protein